MDETLGALHWGHSSSEPRCGLVPPPISWEGEVLLRHLFLFPLPSYGLLSSAVMALLLNGLQQKPVAEIIPITRMTQSARFLAGPAFTLHPVVVFTCSMSHANGFMRMSRWAMDW